MWDIKLPHDVPLNSRYYIRIRENIISDESRNYPLLNLCAFQEMAESIHHSLEYLIRPSLKKEEETKIPDIEVHRLFYICKRVKSALSGDNINIVALSKILKKSPEALVKYWFRINKPVIARREQEIFAYKNT